MREFLILFGTILLLQENCGANGKSLLILSLRVTSPSLTSGRYRPRLAAVTEGVLRYPKFRSEPSEMNKANWHTPKLHSIREVPSTRGFITRPFKLKRKKKVSKINKRRRGKRREPPNVSSYHFQP